MHGDTHRANGAGVGRGVMGEKKPCNNRVEEEEMD